MSHSDDESDFIVKHVDQKAFPEAEPPHSFIAIEKNLYCGPALASALAEWDTLTVDIGGPLTRAVHFKDYFDPDIEVYGPKNQCLFHSLLSALSLKYLLTQPTTGTNRNFFMYRL
ncbi:hypothetical protein CVT25_005496 [Psilocybe cyanescens]|uniref:Uncharacterized protein n=1 Tax=Psilocybe cyanescens TaxID=93625 RepID=A0A409VZW5_PSICY|nr:hypothetical protein CVT25_005496 [Psilocybe cyanescens]